MDANQNTFYHGSLRIADKYTVSVIYGDAGVLTVTVCDRNGNTIGDIITGGYDDADRRAARGDEHAIADILANCTCEFNAYVHGDTCTNRGAADAYADANRLADSDTDLDDQRNTIAFIYANSHIYAYINCYSDRIAIRDGYGHRIAILHANGDRNTVAVGDEHARGDRDGDPYRAGAHGLANSKRNEHAD